MKSPSDPSEQATILKYMKDNQLLAGSATCYDLELFLALNEEYAARPLIPSPRQLDDDSRLEYARDRARLLDERLGLRGRKVLEVGCGAGDLSVVLARDYDCEVVAVDVAAYDTWERLAEDKLAFVQCDLSDPDQRQRVAAMGTFERIISLVVWEHVEHPHAMLQACRDLLSDKGRFYLRANLYRSAVASHLYREVFFPWPHLLFDDDVFRAFYERMGRPPESPAWINKLSYAHYLLYFDQLGLYIDTEWLTKRPIDEAFYQRFYDRLCAYPLFDLELDFFDVVLRKPLMTRLGLLPWRNCFIQERRQRGYRAALDSLLKMLLRR